MDDEAVVVLGRGDRAVCLCWCVLDGRHLVALFQHDVGFAERALGIAEAELLVIVFVVIFEVVMRVGFVDYRRARFERLLDVEHGREWIVVDAHERPRRERRRLGLRDDGNHGLALVADLVDGERRLVVLAEVDEAEQRVLVHRHVGAAQHALDAGRARRRCDVDVADPGVVVRAAHHFQVEQAFEGVIVVEPGPAGDVTGHVLALETLADDVEVVVALVGEDVFAEFEHPLPSPVRRAGRPGGRRPPGSPR